MELRKHWRHLILMLSTLLACTAAHADDNSEAWLEQGWQQMQQNHPDLAISTWEAGLRTMPAERKLGSLGLFSHFEYALERLHKAGKAEKAVIVHDPAHNHMFHVLTVRQVLEDIKLRQVQLAALKRKVGIRGNMYAATAGSFTASVNKAANRSKQSQKATRHPAPRTGNVPVSKIAEIKPESSRPATQQGVPQQPESSATADWLTSGWQSLEASDYSYALLQWQRGFNTLDASQPVSVTGSFSQLQYAIDRARRIGKERGAIIVRPGKGQHALFFVLVVQHSDADKPQPLQTLTGLHEGFYTSGGHHFQSGSIADDHFAHVKLFVPHNRRQPRQVASLPLAQEPDAFLINRFEVNGNKVMPTDLILISLRDYYYGEHSGSEFKQIRRDVIDLYEMSGYSKVRVGLPQKVDRDTIEISIDEARIVP